MYRMYSIIIRYHLFSADIDSFLRACRIERYLRRTSVYARICSMKAWTLVLKGGLNGMIEIEKPNIETVEISDDATFGKFVVEPLERGYGTTIGNSIRRILLSSLPGAAVTSVQIDGALHEFSTIDGVVEDVTTIILNLKKLALRIYSDDVKTLEIDAQEEGIVTAADLTYDSDVEVLNPELPIATLNSSGRLYMRITAERGRGYRTAEENKQDNQPIGVIPVDSIFTPVSRVNYQVENTRIGQVANYDKLTFDVWTNGSIRPEEAVSLGAKVFTEQDRKSTRLNSRHVAN